MNKNILKYIAYITANILLLLCIQTYNNNEKTIYNFSVNSKNLSYTTVALVSYDNKTRVYTPYCGGVWLHDNYILTAFHCVVDTLRFENDYNKNIIGKKILYVTTLDAAKLGAVATEFYKSKNGVVVSADKNVDLALIKVIDNLSYHINTNPYRGLPQIGDKIHVIGHTAGMTYSYTQGHIASIRYARPYFANRKIKLLQIDATIHKGNSGGGVFDDHGNLLGISSFLLLDSNIAFFIHHHEIIDFLNKSKILY